jgi:hypothetical protein
LLQKSLQVHSRHVGQLSDSGLQAGDDAC